MAYDRSGTYDCNACPFAISIQRNCKRQVTPKLMDDPSVARKVQMMLPITDPNFERVTCWKAQVPDEIWPMLDIARAYQKHGTLWCTGGLGDQPIWWWRQVNTVLSLASSLDQANESGKRDVFDRAMKEFKAGISKSQFKRSQGKRG